MSHAQSMFMWTLSIRRAWQKATQISGSGSFYEYIWWQFWANNEELNLQLFAYLCDWIILGPHLTWPASNHLCSWEQMVDDYTDRRFYDFPLILMPPLEDDKHRNQRSQQLCSEIFVGTSTKFCDENWRKQPVEVVGYEYRTGGPLVSRHVDEHLDWEIEYECQSKLQSFCGSEVVGSILGSAKSCNANPRSVHRAGHLACTVLECSVLTCVSVTMAHANSLCAQR